MAALASQLFSSFIRRASVRRGFAAWLVDGVLEMVTMVAGWDDLARQRRALARLDARLLQDIGRTRREADREAGRWPPPWRAPVFRRDG